MNNKILMTGCALLAAFAAVAMPTRKELAAAKQLVEDITAPELEALKMRKKTAKEVGDFHMEQMKSAATEAERFHLLQGAFKLYARGKDYDAAAEALAAMNREIKNLPPEFVVELVQKEMRRVAGERAPKVLVIFNAARRLVKFRKELPRLERAAKARPKDAAVQAKLGECCAELGKWPEALAAFAKSGRECAKMAKGELDGKIPPQTLADYWWDYGNPDDDDEMSVYRVHAAELYRKALADTTFVGLRKSRAEMRVAQAKDHLEVTTGADLPNVALDVEAYKIKTGGSSPFVVKGNVATLTFSNGTTMDFIKCPAGKYDMVYDNKDYKKVPVELTRPFWISKTHLTKGEYGAIFPEIERLNHKKIKTNERAWTAGKTIEDDGLFARLAADFQKYLPNGYVMRFPSLAEYYYAYHANTTDRNDPYYHNRDGNISQEQKKLISAHGKNPGETLPNQWGICDMRGWCSILDRFDVDNIQRKCKIVEPISGKDPFYWKPSDDYVCVAPTAYSYGYWDVATGMVASVHCHLVIGPDLVKEWKEKQAKNRNVESSPVAKPVDRPLAVAKTASAFQIKGNEATLDLGGKYGKLEFVKCPAGMVKVIENKQGKTRKVKISRDFWIMKAPTTALQNSVSPVLGEYGHLSRDMTDGLATYLSSHFEDDLPKGMVIRLPTIAEWEYAYHANTKDKKDPFYDLANVGGAKKWHETMTAKSANGKTRENKWGLYNFATWERVLDKFPREVFASQGWDPVKNDRKQKGGWFQARECPLPGAHVDTFSWTEDKDALIVSRSAQWTGWFVDKYTDNDWGPVFRLVIGPDLVKEWKEKQAKGKNK